MCDDIYGHYTNDKSFTPTTYHVTALQATGFYSLTVTLLQQRKSS